MINKSRFKGWMKLYGLGTIIAISLILIITFTIFYTNKINNLQETILILSLLSPYVILYIQQIKKKKESKGRLKVIGLKLNALIKYLHKYSHRIALIDFNFSSISEFYTIASESIEIQRHYKIVRGLINDIKNNNINDLTKMRLFAIEPEGLSIHYTDKYLIGIRGIIEISSGNEISSDKNKVEEITKEIDDFVLMY